MVADSFIRVPPDSTGKRIDSDELTVGPETVYRERDRIAGEGATELAAVRETDATPLDGGVVVRDAPPDSIQTSHGNSVATAAGASDDIDSAQITAGKTAKLIQLVVASTVPFKAELKTVTNGVASAVLATFVVGDFSYCFEPKTKEAFTVAQDAGAGLDAFRVTFTNLDTGEAADGYASFLYDEV